VFLGPKFLQKVKITGGPHFFLRAAEFFFWTGRKVLQRVGNTIHPAQMFLDDVGVVVSMVSITLLALIVVIFKVLIFDPSVGILL
jgi:hypothetical protein